MMTLFVSDCFWLFFGRFFVADGWMYELKKKKKNLCECVCSQPSEIFSPDSTGSRKTSRARMEIRMQGRSRLMP